jgi:hypothetical protein
VNFNVYGQTLISSNLGYGRASQMVAVVYDIEKPVLEAKESEFDTTYVLVTAKNQANAAVNGADVRIYQASSLRNTDYFVEQSTMTALNLPFRTNLLTAPANGTVRYNVTAAAWDPTIKRTPAGALYTDYDDVSRATQPEMFVKASLSGAYSLLGQTTFVIEPLKQVAYASFAPVKEAKAIGEAVELTFTVLDESGAPLGGIPVSLAISLGRTITPTVVTDASGTATFVVDTSDIADTVAAFIAAELTTGGTPEGSTARILVAAVNEAPTVQFTSPTAGGKVAKTFTVMGMISDANGIASATIKVDDGAAGNLGVTAGTTSFAISKELADLATGDHTIVVVATDSLGVENTVQVSFTVEKAKMDWAMLGLAVAGWAVAAALLVLMVMKMRKPSAPSPAGPEETEVAPEPEVEKP